MLKLILIIYIVKKKFLWLDAFLKKNKTFFNFKKKIILYDNVLIKYIGSNHPKRLYQLNKVFKINKNISALDYRPNQNIKKNIFIVGDSHAEYHGRNFEKIIKKYKINFRTIWMGPNLLINFCNNGYHSNLIIKKLKKLKKLNIDKKLNLILCYGEIDLRIAFYRLLFLNKKFETDDDLIQFYVKSLEKKFYNFQKEISVKCKVKVNIFFKEITPPTNEGGMTPVNSNQLKEIMKANEFPILGDKFDRADWNKKLNLAIKQSSIKKYFLSIPIIGINENGMINENYSDNHHYTDNEYLELCQDHFLKQIKKTTTL